MKTLEKTRKNNICLEYYIDLTEIDKRLVNIIVNKNLNLTQIDHHYQSAAN